MRKTSVFASIFLFASGLAGCAPAVKIHPASALEPAASVQEHILAKEVSLQLDTGFSRKLPAGSRWAQLGTTREGHVYKRIDGVLTVEGAHVHEAYLVVKDGKVTGFRLPVENGFTPFSGDAAVDFINNN